MHERMGQPAAAQRTSGSEWGPAHRRAERGGPHAGSCHGDTETHVLTLNASKGPCAEVDGHYREFATLNPHTLAANFVAVAGRELHTNQL